MVVNPSSSSHSLEPPLVPPRLAPSLSARQTTTRYSLLHAVDSALSPITSNTHERSYPRCVLRVEAVFYFFILFFCFHPPTYPPLSSPWSRENPAERCGRHSVSTCSAAVCECAVSVQCCGFDFSSSKGQVRLALRNNTRTGSIPIGSALILKHTILVFIEIKNSYFPRLCSKRDTEKYRFLATSKRSFGIHEAQLHQFSSDRTTNFRFHPGARTTDLDRPVATPERRSHFLYSPADPKDYHYRTMI